MTLISCKTTVAHLVSKYHIPKPKQNWYRKHQKHDLYCKLKELEHRKLGHVTASKEAVSHMTVVMSPRRQSVT